MATRFPTCAFRNSWRRSSPDTCAIRYREFSLASIQLVAGAALFGFGLVFGLYHWWSSPPDQLVPTGTIMIAALTFLIGFQLLLSFLNYDISASQREALHPFLTRSRPLSAAHESAKASAPEA